MGVLWGRWEGGSGEASLQGQWGLHWCTWCLLLNSFPWAFHPLYLHCVEHCAPAASVQLCHCRHRLNGRCPHSGTGRLEVRQKAASGRACPRCSSRGGMSVLPQGCLLAGFCPVGTFVHRLTLSSVAPPTPTPGDLGPHTCLGLSQHRASSSALGHRWAFPSGRRLLENQAVVVRGGGQGLRGTVS